jgi:hypothetical protein
MFPAGKIPISLQDGKGKGKIIFPNAGSFSVYHILVDDNPVFTANFPKPTEAPIFVVEDYGIRLQIQNSRNLGVAVISIANCNWFPFRFSSLKMIRARLI